MKKKIISGALMLCLLSFLWPAAKVFAVGTTLSLSGTGDGDSVQVNVTGDANSSVLFSYLKNGAYQTNVIGATNSSGSFSSTISTAAYGISPNSLVHVNVGGFSGPQSADVAWPYSSAGTLTLDKTSVVLPVGQSTVINAQNNGSNLIYLASNSNPLVATVNLNGNQITVIANNYGSTVVNVCSQSNTTNCASTYVSVQNASSKPLAFSQGNVGLTAGQSLAVNIYGGTGTYLLTNNSNSNGVAAAISGAIVNLTANGSSGSAAISICSSDLTACGIVNVTIGSSNLSTLSLSQASPTMSIGQNLSVPISGGNGSYSIFSNSNATDVSASISGGSLSLNALAAGASTIVVCSTAGSCNSLTATVIGANSSGGALALSQNNLWLNVGQNFSLTATGGTAPYSVLPDSSNIATSSINGSIITITGVNAGSDSISVCSAAGGCVQLAVLVNGTGSPAATTNLSLSPSQLFLNYPGSGGTVSLTGNGSYFIGTNSNSVIATAAISGNQVLVTPISSGSNTISVCQNGGQCVNLAVTVNPAVVATPPVATSTAPEADTVASSSVPAIPNNTLVRSPEKKVYYVSGGTKTYISTMAELKAKYGTKKPVNYSDAAINKIPDKTAAKAVAKTGVYQFTGDLNYGASGAAVIELQKKLKTLKLYTGALDGKYSTAVLTAVRKYQKNNKLKETGNVGPSTAAVLNK